MPLGPTSSITLRAMVSSFISAGLSICLTVLIISSVIKIDSKDEVRPDPM